MAFGFRREPGAARGYVNVSNPDFPAGERVSRRQYDKIVERLGQRRHIPGFEQIREAERRIEAVQRELAEREAALIRGGSRIAEALEREALAQARESAAREAAATAKARSTRERQGAGQRRYQSAVSAYLAAKEREGIVMSRLEARRSGELKELVRQLKGLPNPNGDPNIADANREQRLRAVNAIGGWNVFREVYEALYGAPRGYTVRQGGREFGGVLPNGRSARPAGGRGGGQRRRAA